MSFSACTRLFGGACDVPPRLLCLVCTVTSRPSLPPAPSPSAPTPNAGADVPWGSGEEQLRALRAPRFWTSVALLFAITAALTLRWVALGSVGKGVCWQAGGGLAPLHALAEFQDRFPLIICLAGTLN